MGIDLIESKSRLCERKLLEKDPVNMVAVNRNWLTKEEAEAFIGENTYYYLEKWKSHANSTLKGWNWAAMFFNIAWMIYRKMYREALFCLIILYFISFGLSAVLYAFGIDLDTKIINIAFQMFIGFFGNMLYRKKALRVLNKGKDFDDAGRIRFLSINGGVNTTAVIVYLIINFALILLPLIIYLALI